MQCMTILNRVIMSNEDYLSKSLREPLKRFILKMQKTLGFNQKHVYTTAKMSAKSYKRFFDGCELWRVRDRIIIASLVILRDVKEHKKIDEDGYDELKKEWLQVGGDTAIAVEDLSQSTLRKYLIDVCQTAKKRFYS